METNTSVSLEFDLDQIMAFRFKFGDTIIVQVATRYLEERADALSAHAELWLWKEAIDAHVMVPEIGDTVADDGKA